MSEPKDQRVPVMMSVRELRAVDGWRRDQPELPSRSEAIRRLIELGLGATPKKAQPMEPPELEIVFVEAKDGRPTGKETRHKLLPNGQLGPELKEDVAPEPPPKAPASKRSRARG